MREGWDEFRYFVEQDKLLCKKVGRVGVSIYTLQWSPLFTYRMQHSENSHSGSSMCVTNLSRAAMLTLQIRIQECSAWILLQQLCLCPYGGLDVYAIMKLLGFSQSAIPV